MPCTALVGWATIQGEPKSLGLTNEPKVADNNPHCTLSLRQSRGPAGLGFL